MNVGAKTGAFFTMNSAPQARSKRERQSKARRDEDERGLLTLNTILRYIGQVPVTVELCNDTVLVGQLEKSDAYMK